MCFSYRLFSVLSYQVFFPELRVVLSGCSGGVVSPVLGVVGVRG